MIRDYDIEHIHPHPNNPRDDLGDLAELAESLTAQGVLQNLTVVPEPGTEYDGAIPNDVRIVIGHRRHGAALIAGLESLPCTLSRMDEKEQIGTMLLENMQREDLTPYEEAKGFQMMLNLGSTVSEIAEKTGFSKATVKHRVEIAKLDGDKVKERIAKGATLFDFIELEKVSDPKSKASLLEVIGTANFNYSLKDTLDKEEAKRNKARILEPIEAKLKPLPKGAATWQYESVYQYIHLRDDTKTEDIKLPRDAKFYKVTGLHIEIYGNMRDGYVANPNKEKDEAAKKEDFERRTKALAEVCERMYALRLDFMQNITKTELNKAKEHILKTALGCIAYRERPSEGVIVSMLGISEDDIGEDEDASQYLIETFQSTSLYKMFVMTYAALDQPGLTWHSANSWNATIYPPEGDDAERLYPFLEGFGYQESDEEKQIIDGSHPLYVEGAGAGNE